MFPGSEDVLDRARTHGWTTISIKNDWTTVSRTPSSRRFLTLKSLAPASRVLPTRQHSSEFLRCCPVRLLPRGLPGR